MKVPQLKVPGHRVTPLDLPYLTKTDWPIRLIPSPTYRTGPTGRP